MCAQACRGKARAFDLQWQHPLALEKSWPPDSPSSSSSRLALSPFMWLEYLSAGVVRTGEVGGKRLVAEGKRLGRLWSTAKKMEGARNCGGPREPEDPPPSGRLARLRAGKVPKK